MNTLPKVIGYVPTYNASKFIRSTLSKLADQSYQNLEIIVCDDASTDDTYEICLEFARNHPNFKVIQNEKNLGWLKTSDQLWQKASETSSYCFFNAHDDHPRPDYVSQLVGLLQAKPSAVLAIPGMKNIYHDGVIIESFYKAASDEPDVVKRTIQVAKRNIHHWWSAYHGLHRSSSIRAILPFSPLPFGERQYSVDLVWMVKMALHGEFITSSDILLEKYYLPNSVSSAWAHSKFNRLALWTAILNEIRKANIPQESKRKLWRELLFLAANKMKAKSSTT